MTPAKLKSLRLARGIKASHVAKQCGISQPYLNLIEHGLRPMPEAVEKLYRQAIGLPEK